jgi:hypothetical protein
MDFHRAFEDTIEKFPEIRGMIFIDPDGESIVHYHPGMSEFEVRLTGAKISVLVQTLLKELSSDQLKAVETETATHYSFFQPLKLDYSLLVIARKTIGNHRLRDYIMRVSEEFNEEIL